jgi:hypothetical protein
MMVHMEELNVSVIESICLLLNQKRDRDSYQSPTPSQFDPFVKCEET